MNNQEDKIYQDYILKQLWEQQKLPLSNSKSHINDLVVSDIQTRKELKTPSRDTTLQDVYEKLIDSTLYCKQQIEETDALVLENKRLEEQVIKLQEELNQLLLFRSSIRDFYDNYQMANTFVLKTKLNQFLAFIGLSNKYSIDKLAETLSYYDNYFLYVE